jgi:hypothetical protein
VTDRLDRTIQGPELAAHLTDSCRIVLAYWERIRGARAFPLRADFDPFELPRQLPGVQLVEVLVAGRPVASAEVADGELAFVYRVVGTRETEARGRNPTGAPIEEGFFGGCAARVRRSYTTVFRTAEPLLDIEIVETRAGYPVRDVSLFLPLGRTEDLVGQILVYSEQHSLYAA